MKKIVAIPVSIGMGLLLLVLILDFVLLGGSYFESIKGAIYQKTFLESDCIKTGGVVVSANEIGLTIVHYPGKACAYPYPDAEKECYDNNDCQGACILKSIDENVNTDDSTLGKCQRYRNTGLNCSTERRNGKVITHMCVME